MKIIYKDKNCLVIQKEANVPSAPDPTGTPDALTIASDMLRDCGEDSSLYPIHRLDRVVGGLIVFARNKKSAAELSALVSGEGIGKEYLAVTDAPIPGGVYTDLIYKDARQSKSFIVDRTRAGVREATLTLTPICEAIVNGAVRSLVRVRLKTGRFHQIRAQLSHRGSPITGDKKYGSRDSVAKFPSLFAYKLEFDLAGKRISLVASPDTSAYPWSLFRDEIKALTEDK